MLILPCLVASLFFITGQCLLLIPPHQENHQQLIQCVIGILNKYFSEINDLTFVNIQTYADDLQKAIHLTTNFTLISRLTTKQMVIPNIEYLVISANVKEFSEYFHCLTQEPAWNPNARFLIIIRSLHDKELKLIFNELLIKHVNNVLIVNGTEEAHLYTYNPFKNFACGRYYDTITNFGQCSQVTDNNLYRNKLVTGLRNCNFRASLTHNPPLTIDPLTMKNNKNKVILLGLEEYVIKLLAKKEEFSVSFDYSNDVELFSTVTSNMTTIGPMSMLQKNECDIMFGGIMMVAPRIQAFTYLNGHHDYGEELVFVVKRASLVPNWKYIYQEFTLEVWILLLIAFIVYTVIIVYLLNPVDVSDVVLRLLDNLLLHGRDIHTRMSLKLVLITWVWFAYLVNTFYQTILFSFITHPITEYQISSEQDIIKYDVKPCIRDSALTYIYSELNKQNKSNHFRHDRCQNTSAALNTVMSNKNMYTMMSSYRYLYNEIEYTNKWGEPLVYILDKPYAKYLYGFFFYKGFPITKSLQQNVLRITESGLGNKIINEHFYRQRIKQKFYVKPFESHILLPWCVCVPGFMASIIAFFVELLTSKSKTV